MKKLLMLIPLLVSCNATMQHKAVVSKAPSWVKTVRNGGSLRVLHGREMYYRNSYSGTESGSVLCEKAVENNIANIKRAYPFITHVPMTVKVIYYDPIIRDCSTTVALSTSFINKVDEIKDQTKIAEALKKENELLKTSNLKLKTFINKNKRLKSNNSRLRVLSRAIEVKIKRLRKAYYQRANKVVGLHQEVFCGMTRRDYKSLSNSEHVKYEFIFGAYFMLDGEEIKETITLYKYGHKWAAFGSRTTGYIGYCNSSNKKRCYNDLSAYRKVNNKFIACKPAY